MHEFHVKTWILIIISTVALIIFLSILIFLYYYWRKRFGLPLRGNSVGSFSRLLGSSTMYVVSILGHQGRLSLLWFKNSKLFMDVTIWSQPSEIWWRYYHVAVIYSAYGWSLVVGDHHFDELLWEHLDLLLDFN